MTSKDELECFHIFPYAQRPPSFHPSVLELRVGSTSPEIRLVSGDFLPKVDYHGMAVLRRLLQSYKPQMLGVITPNCLHPFQGDPYRRQFTDKITKLVASSANLSQGIDDGSDKLNGGYKIASREAKPDKHDENLYMEK